MKRIFHLLTSIFFLAFLWNCAQTGSPSGGPRDITPPVVVRTKPVNGALNFKGKQVEITFDEYINSQEISNEMIISPPFEERIETRMRGKTLIIELEDSLRENTTYTLSFGQSIEDLNEGNVLQNYEFIFSTGDYLDSLAVAGMALQAFDLEPLEEEVRILLYTNLNDSAPYLEVPDYLGKATGEGAFLINNIRPDTYRLFALQDQNRNLIYDIPEEQIGFLDTLIVLSPDLFEYIDTLPAPEPDTAWADTTLIGDGDSLALYDLARYSVMVDVYVFQEDLEPQYMIDHKREDPRKLTLLFNREVRDTVLLEPLNFSPPPDWLLPEFHVRKDTFEYWIRDSLIYRRDSLKIKASYQITDSLMNYVDFEDTLDFIYREPVRRARRGRNEPAEEEQEKLSLNLNVRNGQDFDPFRDITITAAHPVSGLDTSRIEFTRKLDTLEFPADYTLERDSRNLRLCRLSSGWDADYSYNIRLYPGAVTGLYGLTHDTLVRQFQIRHADYYGTIQVNLTGVDANTLLQIMDVRGNVIRQSSIGADGRIEFPYLGPATYTLKSIRDVNGNGKWDTGNYLEGIQPERVAFHPESITLRSNFQYEVNWDLSQ